MATQPPPAKLSSKYQIVIPKIVRKRMHLKAGTPLMIQPIDDRHAMVTKYPHDYVEAMKGLGKEMWKALGGATRYIKHERASWKKSSASTR